jgi:molecular chaperone GrpE
MADETNKQDPSATSPEAQTEAQAASAAPSPEARAEQTANTEPDLVQRLTAEVEKLEGQIADLTDRLLRAHADMDNIRKRADRDREETAKYAITKFARDVVGVADNFERAVQAVPAGAAEQDNALKSLVEGVTMTEREFVNVLERHGIKRINPKGEIFNPHQHQAMMEIQNPDLPSGTITDVFQPGYVIEDRVLRPAMVVVAKGGQKQSKPAEATSEQAPGPEVPPEPSNG